MRGAQAGDRCPLPEVNKVSFIERYRIYQKKKTIQLGPKRVTKPEVLMWVLWLMVGLWQQFVEIRL